jgi:hypothetical protein
MQDAFWSQPETTRRPSVQSAHSVVDAIVVQGDAVAVLTEDADLIEAGGGIRLPLPAGEGRDGQAEGLASLLRELHRRGVDVKVEVRRA